MPTIPTPFIGGAGGPQADRTRNDEVAPPFFIEDTEEAGAPVPEPTAEPVPAAAAEAESEPDSEEGPFESLGSVLEEEAAPIETLTDELATAPAFGEHEEPANTDDLIDLVLTESADAGFDTDEDGVPDFLGGDDAVGPDEPFAETPAAPKPPASAGEIEAEARTLLAGDLGDWIRQLTAELGPKADETAVSRAFAAGYLAARAEEEKE